MARKKKEDGLSSTEADLTTSKSILESELLSKVATPLSEDPAKVDFEGPKEKRLKGPLLNLALLTFLFAILLSIFSILTPFKSVEKVDADIKTSLSVQVTIESAQFSKAPALTACNGSGRIPNLDKAIVTLESKADGWKVKAPLGSGQINSYGECVYSPQFETPEKFNGGVVKPRVDFTFGLSIPIAEVNADNINLTIKLNS